MGNHLKGNLWLSQKPEFNIDAVDNKLLLFVCKSLCEFNTFDPYASKTCLRS